MHCPPFCFTLYTKQIKLGSQQSSQEPLVTAVKVFFKCLVCQLFPNLDKILYLDIDIVLLNKGLQEFMDVDLTNYYVNACTDVVPTYNNRKELQNCKTDNY